jgi:hypothetical protein
VTVCRAVLTWKLRDDGAFAPNKAKTIGRYIEGKLVVITDANRGLGESPARHLAELGAMLILRVQLKDRLNANC